MHTSSEQKAERKITAIVKQKQQREKKKQHQRSEGSLSNHTVSCSIAQQFLCDRRYQVENTISNSLDIFDTVIYNDIQNDDYNSNTNNNTIEPNEVLHKHCTK